MVAPLFLAVASSSRRAVVIGGATQLFRPPSVTAADAYSELQSRISAPVVVQQGFAAGPGRTSPALPGWLAGEWRCEQTLQAYSTPLGIQYIGAAGRPLSEATASAQQTKAQIGKPVILELRYSAVAGGGAVEDRPFNAKSRLDAFAGRPVVRAANSCGAAGVDSIGLSCTFVEFRGPISQKQIVSSALVATPTSGAAGGTFVSSDCTRAILARRKMAGDTRDFPPITTDSEVLVSLTPNGDASPDAASGQLRLVEYLNPNDPLYFAAGRKSVSISDYSLSLRRMQG